MALIGQVTVRLITTVSFICLGSLQFGYHMAELNSPQSVLSCKIPKPGNTPYSQTWFYRHGFVKCIPLTNEDIGAITSIFSVGGLIGSFFVGSICDSLGRKKTAIGHCFIFFIGSTIIGLSNSYSSLILGRFIAGIAAGAALATAPVFINEVAPPHIKGFLGSMNQVSVNIGILLTQLCSLKWSNDNQWRYLLLMGSLLSIFNLVAIVFFVDESPMWLYNHGYFTKAYDVLHDIRGEDYTHARNEVNSWAHGLDERSLGSNSTENQELLDPESGEINLNGVSTNSSISLKDYLQAPEYLNSRLISTGILIAQQFCGINSIIFYGVSVLISVFPDYSIVINCLISVLNVVVTFAAAPLIDQWGRKPLLLLSVTIMGISTVLMAFGIIWSSAFFSIVGTFSFVGFFAIGLGPIPFLLVSEVSQPKVKAVAQSWGTSCNWFATGLVGYLFPILKNSWLGGGVYFIFTAFCVFTFWFIKKFIPETKGAHSYEEVWNRFTS